MSARPPSSSAPPFLSKATGAYMPLEIVYPADLLEGVLKQVKPPVVLTQVCVRLKNIS